MEHIVVLITEESAAFSRGFLKAKPWLYACKKNSTTANVNKKLSNVKVEPSALQNSFTENHFLSNLLSVLCLRKKIGEDFFFFFLTCVKNKTMHLGYTYTMPMKLNFLNHYSKHFYLCLQNLVLSGALPTLKT